MKIALYDEWRVGVVSDDHRTITDITAVVPGHDPDAFGAGWWVRWCRDLERLRPSIERVLSGAPAVPLDSVRLRPPVLNPGKVIAAAGNYPAHSAEMDAVIARTTPNAADRQTRMREVFLKAPSSIVGPNDAIVLPADLVADDREIHHEAELVVVIGSAGAHIAVAEAMTHVLGYTIGIDVTLRGPGDRSRRKSYDTFTPVGPWLTTADEIADPRCLDVQLSIHGDLRQNVSTSEMDISVAELVSFASSLMSLQPGDLIFTGAPPGVGRIVDGDDLRTSITGLGELHVTVRSGDPPSVAVR